MMYDYIATITKIHDGDTVYVTIRLCNSGRLSKWITDEDLGFNIHRTKEGIFLKDQSVRLLGCDAPELKTPEGQDAKAYIETLIQVGDKIQLHSAGWDKFGGRIDGSITLADGRDLTKAMIDAGHAKVWNGEGPKPT